MAEQNKTLKKEAVEKKVAKKEVKPIKQAQEIDPWKTLLYPHMAEKSMALVDTQNKIVFVVKMDANKGEIKQAFEKLFDVKISSIKTEKTMAGQKKAFIKLQPAYSAADIATKLGIL